MNTQELLEKLTELYAQADALRLEKEQLIDDLTPTEIKKAIENVRVEYSDKEQAVSKNIADLEGEVKQAVIDAGETAKGGALQAVYNKGRVSWDSKKLEGLMIAFPRIEEARKQGDPYVAIKKVQ